MTAVAVLTESKLRSIENLLGNIIGTTACFLFPIAVLAGGSQLARAASADLSPVTAADGQFIQTTVAGEMVWQNSGTSSYLYFRRPAAFAFDQGQTLYVRVTYFDDQGEGKLKMQYDGQAGTYLSPAVHTRTSRVASGRFVDGFYELTAVFFGNRQSGGADFRISCGAPGGMNMSVQRVTLADTPFTDPDFQLALTRPWQTRYTGPAKDDVDPTTLKGKVMTGYQGWFRTPNDLDDDGWRHWVRNNSMTAENFTVDMWPDLTQYDPATLARAGSVMTASGASAYLFSSTSYAAVQKHFRWMRKHNLDGAWLQRFHPNAGTTPEWVLRNVSQAAAEEGRVWGVEYDVSGMEDATVATRLQADWLWLTTRFGILHDPRYVHEDGKPVVFIWGLSVPNRNFTPATADAVVDWFKAQGCHVLGGLPNTWSELSADWQAHIARYDGVLVWMSQSTSDAAYFRSRGQDFYPHIWPGFSWAHLKQLPADSSYTNRNGGQFFWDKGRAWINAGADRLFIGMFDEYDESTAIMPATDDSPEPWTDYGRFISNQGKPGDWWMMLADELKRMMWGQRANTGTLPTIASLGNRSNIGPEASIDLGATDSATWLARAQVGDGDTVVENVGGKECRGNLDPATDRYMYFKVDDTFAYQLSDGDVTIEVEYHDITGNTVLGVQYDSTSTTAAKPAYTEHPQPITTTGSKMWRTVRFEIANAYFGNRQNGGADFRLNFNGKKLSVNRVWVRLPEPKTYPFTWTNATAGQALDWSRNANWLGGVVAQPGPTSVVRFFPGQVMTGGTVQISIDLSGQVFNRFQFGGNASTSADTNVTLSGSSLSLEGATPGIELEANKSACDLTYNLVAPVSLHGVTQIGGNGDATFQISGPIGGSGSLTKTGTAIATLSGPNTYAGNTTVNAGTLRITQAPDPANANPGNDASTVTIAATDATLDLTYGGTDVVKRLFIGIDQLPAGLYGKTGSGPPVIGIPQITGNGTLTVSSSPPQSAYALWASTNAPATGTDPNADEDHDSVANAIEYVLGGTLLSRDLSRLPTISCSDSNLLFTFERDQASINAGTTLTILAGTSLRTWPDRYLVGADTAGSSGGVTVLKGVPEGFDTVILSLPRAASIKQFIRLAVTVTP